MTLQQAVDRAREANLTIRRAQNSVEVARENFNQSKFNYVPTVNAGINGTRSFGTTFDQVTFQRIQQNTNTSNPSITANLPLFQGLANYYTYQQTRANLDASLKGLERTENEILATVLQSYLQVILDQVSINTINQRLELLRTQLDRQQKLLDGGRGIEFDVLNVQSQIAVEELNLITARNQQQRNQITLLQQLDLNPAGETESGYTFEAVDTALLKIAPRTDVLPSASSVENYALEYFPDLQEQESLMKAQQWGLKNANAAYWPTLTLSGGLQSSFSSNGGQFLVDTLTGDFTRTRTAYFEQIDDNQSQFLSLRLNIPILGNWRTRQQVNLSRLQLQGAAIDLAQGKNTLIRNVREAYLNTVAARERVLSLERQEAALRRAYQDAENRYNNGLLDFVGYREALNNYTRVQLDQVQGLYEYFFRKKVLDFYQGKPITF